VEEQETAVVQRTGYDSGRQGTSGQSGGDARFREGHEDAPQESQGDICGGAEGKLEA